MGRTASSKQTVRDEVTRIAAALRSAIRLSGVSHRQIERELGLSSGYLTRILAGQVELRLAHVLAVCEIIGLPAGTFFTSLFVAQTAPTQPEARLARGLAELHPAPATRRGAETILRELRGCLAQLEAELRPGGEKSA